MGKRISAAYPKTAKMEKMFPNFSKGDLVLIADDNLPRNAWNQGLVVETTRDKNGLVRNAKIKTATALLDRPITKLCLLSTAEDIIGPQ